MTVSEGPRIAGEAADVGLVAGSEDERVLGSHPGRDLFLELSVHRDGPVHQPRAGKRGSILLERVTGSVLDAPIASQAEVVVRPEHEALAALHLHDRACRALDLPEVGDQVLLARKLDELTPVVMPRLLEQVYGR